LFIALLHLIHGLLKLLPNFFLGLAGLLQLHLLGGTRSGGGAGAFEATAGEEQRYGGHHRQMAIARDGHEALLKLDGGQSARSARIRSRWPDRFFTPTILPSNPAMKNKKAAYFRGPLFVFALPTG